MPLKAVYIYQACWLSIQRFHAEASSILPCHNGDMAYLLHFLRARNQHTTLVLLLARKQCSASGSTPWEHTFSCMQICKLICRDACLYNKWKMKVTVLVFYITTYGVSLSQLSKSNIFWLGEGTVH